MKKDTNPLKTNWRKFKTEFGSVKAPQKVNSASSDTIKLNKPQKLDNVSSRANKSGGIKPLGLSKYLNSPKNVIEKFNKNSENISKEQKLMYKNTENWDEFSEMYNLLNEVEKEKFNDWSSARDYSKIQKRPSVPCKLSLDGVKNRRLGANLSRTLSKIAQDKIGADIEGDDFWDTARLTMRQFNKESIFNCRNSRETQNIIILLDSSPSCSRQSNFYSKIASQCVQYGDIELYDAPNGRLVHIYSHKNKEFSKFITMQDVMNNVHQWSLFKNRTILFFGDFDGWQTIMKGTANNKVYYFCNEDEYTCKDELRYFKKYPHSIPYNLNNLELIPNIYNVSKFMEACKKIK